jgi:hypothetical protein
MGDGRWGPEDGGQSAGRKAPEDGGRTPDYDPRTTIPELRATNYELRTTSYELRTPMPPLPSPLSQSEDGTVEVPSTERRGRPIDVELVAADFVLLEPVEQP